MGELPPALATNPRLADWVRIDPAGTITVRSGKVEIGQGVLTALAQIAAEELDVAFDRIRMPGTRTGTSPDEGLTAGSMSVQYSGIALRQACAEVRALLLAAAAEELDTPTDELTVRDGKITRPDGHAISYWKLDTATLLDRAATGQATPKAGADHTVVGRSTPRLDIPDKVTGRPRYIHDLRLPGLAFGRVVRPPSRGAHLLGLDTEPIAARPGVLAVVRDGDFLGVVAEREELAQRAADALQATATWDEHDTLPDEHALPEFLTSQPADTTVLADTTPDQPAEVARTVTARVHRPYLAHASLAPSAAVALAEDDQLSVWSNTQGPYPLRGAIAAALDLDPERISVQHVEGAGGYGHNGADDVAFDAALLARAVPGRPVQVLWSRPDELGWAPFGPAAVVEVAAELDANDEIVGWRHEIWSNGHVGRPGLGPGAPLLAATHRADPVQSQPAADPPLAVGGGSGRNGVPGYRVPALKVISHRLLTMPLRTSALRSLGAFVNVFAIESLMDELAEVTGADPVEFRLRHLDDPRARAVIETAIANAPEVSGESAGRGLGFARYKNTAAYCAVVAEVDAVDKVRVRRLTIAVDAGLAVNPDGLANQIEGGAIQATSWTLTERVRFDRRRVTSDTWETYPILRFSEVPSVEVHIIDRPEQPSLGVGEASQGPTAAAIGNALHDAIGVRVRRLPLTEANVVAAIDAE
jgi:CO/xanthine dehydrogenase Mo-binding subunit